MAPESIVARVFGIPRSTVNDETSNSNVAAWDSLNHVTLILELESAFHVSFAAEEALGMTDVGAIKRTLRTHGVDIDSA
jgi:acyl carrier protein